VPSCGLYVQTHGTPRPTTHFNQRKGKAKEGGVSLDPLRLLSFARSDTRSLSFLTAGVTRLDPLEDTPKLSQACTCRSASGLCSSLLIFVDVV
jgi:hypothetical protein